MPTDIIGHEKVLSFLEKSLKNGRLSQAYLFVGPHNIGKTAVAEWLTKQVLGPLGFNHPDASVLSRLTDEKTGKIKSEIVINQVRNLRERLSMSGLASNRKVAFIEDADALNTEASNALLKTLEEPTLETVLILRTSSLDRVLPTIISRCQIIRFSVIIKIKIIEALVNRGVLRSEAEIIASLSAGRPGHALRLLRDEEARSLEEVSLKQFVSLVKATTSERLASVSSWLPKDENNKEELAKDLLNRWERLLREVLLFSLDIKELTMGASLGSDFELLAKSQSYEHWISALENLRVIKNDLSFHVNATLALEKFVLSL